MNKRSSIGLVALVAMAVALLVCPPAAEAQYTFGGADVFIAAGTNNVAAGATNNYTAISLNPQKSEYLGLSFNYNFTVAPIGVTPTVVARLQRSLDAVNWETTPFHVFTINGATNNLTWITNITVASMPWYRLSIENTNSSAITNLLVWQALKR